MTRRHNVFLAVTIVFTAVAAQAYVLNAKWATQQVPYYVNPSNKHMSAGDAVAALQAGAASWTAQSSANIVPVYAGYTSTNTFTRNNQNDVFFRDVYNGTLYGETYWWTNSSNQIVEADVVFYTAGQHFYPGSSGCSGVGFYLQDTMTHEFGHALGLGHSSSSSASMYPYLTFCSTSGRSLDADDVAGIEKLYPPGGVTNTAPSLAIQSPDSGLSILQTIAISLLATASDREDGDITSFITWHSSRDGYLGTGGSLLKLLSVGSHTITATVSDRGGLSTSRQTSVSVTALLDPVSSPPTSSGISLSASGHKVRGFQRANLSWSGGSTSNVDVYRNGGIVMVTPNDGRETDLLNTKGSGSYTYQVCEAGTSVCSNSVVVTF